MSGDYSRDSFDALRDFAGVFLQQGRAVLDADWNEMVAIVERRIRAGTVDTIGRAVVPRETADGFEIQHGRRPAASTIGRGRMYVDGMLVENHGRPISRRRHDAPDRSSTAPARRDGGPAGVLDELISPAAGDFVDYDAQPYWPTPAAAAGDGGPHLAYLDVWQREVTPLEDPACSSPRSAASTPPRAGRPSGRCALLADVGDGATCATPTRSSPAGPRCRPVDRAPHHRDDRRSRTPRTPASSPRPTAIPASRTSSTASRCTRRRRPGRRPLQVVARERLGRRHDREPSTRADRVTVRRIGRDDILRFRTGDWVEVTDDRRELARRSGEHAPGRRRRRGDPRDVRARSTPLDADLDPHRRRRRHHRRRHSRLIRWDQRGTSGSPTAPNGPTSTPPAPTA